jgi:Dockerin type I domain/Kelch motif
MKKQILTLIITRLTPTAFLLVLPFVLGPATHQAMGQRSANLPQIALSATGATSGIHAVSPAKPSTVVPERSASGDAPGPWSIGTPYPTTIVRYGFAQTATHFYVFGGVSDGNRVNNVNRMNISTGVWESRAAMPFASEAPTCALMPGTNFVYCTEGDTGSGFARYDVSANTWTSLASIPGGDHYGSASGAFNGKVFVAGGTTSFSSAVQVYTVATNTWSAGAAAPNDFLLAGYQQVGQYLYVVGGFEASGPNKVAGELSSVLSRGHQPKQPVPLANNTTTWRLDMSSAPGVWSVGPAFTQGRADFGLAYDAGTNKLYAMGGDATGGTFFDSTNLVDELSVASWPAGTWAASPPNLILPNRQANQAGFYGGAQIWSVGGIVGQTFQFLSEVQHRSNGGGGGGCQFKVLIVYADTAAPTQLQMEIQAESGVTAVDLFDAQAGTPTLAQLQQYDIVVPYSNFPFADATTLGNNLADYVDGGGIVVQYGFSHYGPAQPYGVNGRWVTGNYNPYNYSTNLELNAFTLGTHNAAHPLMAGVTTLNSNFANIVTLAAGATEVAQNSLSESLVAFRPVSGGHTTVGVTAYVGNDATQNGDWGKVIVNAGRWLLNCQGCQPNHYTISQIGGPIVPGTTDTGNHGDDTVVTVALPFSYTLYDQTFTSINLSSNGNAQFTTTDTAFTNICLPWTTHNYTIFPYWDDLYLVNSGFGIFTSISGNPPNRIFNIEWRAQYFPGSGNANFELRLYEGQSRFDIIYGTVTNGNTSATAGVQKNDTAFDQYFCNGSGGAATGGQSYILQSCAPTVTDAVSRKTHGAAGTFDIEMPLTGSSGVEDRSGGATHDYSLVVTFSGNVTVTGMPQAQVTMGSGCVGSGGTCDPNGTVTVSGNTVTVPLTNIADAQVINARINGVNSASDTPAVDVNIPMGFLIGDVNGNRTVNASDVALTKSQVGHAVDNTNFREDVNTSGTLSATDVSVVKNNVGHSLPP